MPSELEQLGKHAFFGSAFLSNIVLWSESGYFDTAVSFWPALLWLAALHNGCPSNREPASDSAECHLRPFGPEGNSGARTYLKA